MAVEYGRVSLVPEERGGAAGVGVKREMVGGE